MGKMATKEKSKPIYDRWWKIKYYLLGEIPERCPYCGGEVIARGFEGHNRRYQCRKCDRVLISE